MSLIAPRLLREEEIDGVAGSRWQEDGGKKKFGKKMKGKKMVDYKMFGGLCRTAPSIHVSSLICHFPTRGLKIVSTVVAVQTLWLEHWQCTGREFDLRSNLDALQGTQV